MTSRFNLKRVLCCIFAVIFVFSFLPFTSGNVFANDGQQEDEYSIATPAELLEFEQAVNNGTFDTKDVTVTLTDDIDLTALEADVTWVGIGTQDHPFEGIFDGDGYSVTLDGSQGLFAHIKNASVSDVTVFGAVTVEGASDVAGVVGCVEGGEDADNQTLAFVANVGNYAAISATRSNAGGANVAGVLGHVAENALVWVVNSFNKGDVIGSEYVGGIAGRNEGKLSIGASYNLGDVTATRTTSTQRPEVFAGGICASECTVLGAYNTGMITGSYRRNGQNRQRGYAITPGNPTVENVYWLYFNNVVGIGEATSADDFVNGTVLGLLNGNVPNNEPATWIDGAEVFVPFGASRQIYPGLSWEAWVDLDALKAYLTDALNAYVNEANYESYQWDLVERAIALGAEAIFLAEDEAGIDAAYLGAIEAINAIPTSEELTEAYGEIVDSYKDNDYDELQAFEIGEIVLVAEEELEKAKTVEEMNRIVDQAIVAIATKPTSEEVEEAEAAKYVLGEDMKDAIETKSSKEFEFTKESLERLEEALDAAVAIYDNPNAFAQQVLDADKAVRDAIRHLRTGNNSAKDSLLQTLIAAKNVDKSKYTSDSYAAFEKVIAEANALVKDPDAKNADLSNAKTAVLDAQNKLVLKSANPLKATAKSKTVKYKKVRKKNQVVKAITVTNAVGTVSYAKVSGPSKIKVDSKSGKITVKKGTKKGKYTVKIKVKAAGNGKYSAGEKTVSLKIKVK